MDEEKYNIDDILSELRERREKENTEPTEVVEEEPEAIKEEPIVEDTKEENIKEEDQPDFKNDIEEFKDSQNSNVAEQDVPEEETKEESDEIEDENMSDISEISDELPKKKKKTGKIVIVVLLILIIGLVGFGYYYVNNMLNKVVDNSSSVKQTVTAQQWTGMSEKKESFPTIEETDASELSSLKDMIKTWYGNGKPCSSSHVLNVLLIGEDTRGTEILDDGTRADSAIIASINTDTKQITLTSILRDTYSYWETTPGDSSTGQFGKINGAMSTGDINAYINCVENMYKIDIDNFVIVNFDSFETIVDTLGGVTLTIKSSEINEINNHPKRYGNVTIKKTFDGDEGKMKLTGKQALAYCRIRKLDSDNERANRQKKCLIQIYKQASKASNTKLISIATKLIPYVSTGFEKKEILQVAKYALSQHWLSYKTRMFTVPDSRINESGAGGIFYGAWCWKSDFPQDAYDLQYLIYGKSSIKLAETRVDVLNCAETGFYTDGYAPVSATITNYNYGVETTYTLSTKKKTTTKSN